MTNTSESQMVLINAMEIEMQLAIWSQLTGRGTWTMKGAQEQYEQQKQTAKLEMQNQNDKIVTFLFMTTSSQESNTKCSQKHDCVIIQDVRMCASREIL